MTPIAQAVLVYAVLAVGAIVTGLTGVAQLRELPKALRTGKSASLVRRGFLAASVGLGSVSGSILALELGGPGAIGWMWIASFLGMAIVYAEVKLSIGYRRKVAERPRAATVFAFADGVPVVGKTLAVLYALVLVVFAATAGSLLQTQQSSELLATVGGDRWLIVGFLVAAAGVGMLVPKLRVFVAALGPVAVALYVIALLLIIAGAPGDTGAALAAIFSGMFNPGSSELAGGAAGATVLMAMQVGFLRATLATEAGLGSSGFTAEADTVKGAQPAAAAVMLAPLVSGILVPTLTALTTLTATPWVGQRIDEPGERVAAASEREASDQELAELAEVFAEGDPDELAPTDRQRVVALWAPLERPQARGTAASLQAGQTIVLPIDAVAEEGASEIEGPKLVEDHVYPMVMRSNPRGMKMRPNEEKNELLLPLSEQSQVTSEVVYRDRDRGRAQYPAYDIRIPVNNEVFGPPGRQGVRLTPVDEEVDFYRMSKVRDGPYVVFGDFHFEGRVVKMFQNRWGLHHALIEANPDAGRMNLRTAISSAAYRGPYFDNGEPRGPLAMIARESFNAPVGARLLVEYRSPPRGMKIGQLLASGELQTPPWKFLAETEFAIIRHDSDPALDMRVPVTSEFVDGTLRFLSGRKDIADFAKAEIWKNYSGPYLDPPPYRFEVEVHTGARAPASSAYLDRLGEERRSLVGPFSERRTLVAVHEHGEPQGSPRELYDPHPAEVAPFMDGPWVAGKGIERLGWASRMGLTRGADLLLVISVLILALTTMIAWSGYGARAADFLIGRGGGIGFSLLFLAAGLGGATLPLLPVLTLVDYTMLALVIMNGLGLVVLALRAGSQLRS